MKPTDNLIPFPLTRSIPSGTHVPLLVYSLTWLWRPEFCRSSYLLPHVAHQAVSTYPWTQDVFSLRGKRRRRKWKKGVKIAVSLGMSWRPCVLASFLRRHRFYWLALMTSHTGTFPYLVEYVANQHGLFSAQPSATTSHFFSPLSGGCLIGWLRSFPF